MFSFTSPGAVSPSKKRLGGIVPQYFSIPARMSTLRSTPD
jgi:hypothetical protein